MTTIHALSLGDSAVITRTELEHLLVAARRTEQIDLLWKDDLPTSEIMSLAENSGAFNFWLEPGEDIYSIKDGEPI